MVGSFAFVAALISMALTAMPTLADTEMGHTGLVGNHVVFDGTQDGFFGVVCHYRSNNHNKLNNIAVSAPDVYARDVTGSTDSQRVGWRIIVRRLRPGATVMKTFYRSEIWRATASDSTPAVFANEGSPGSHP